MRRAGLSLVELLVVTAVIAVVVALLLPALGGAARRARAVKCAGNCQQIGMALLSYGEANKTWLPVMPAPAPVLENQSIYGGLAGLLSLNQQGDGLHTGFTGGQYSTGASEPLLSGYLDGFGALLCPSDKEDRYYGMPYTPQGTMSYASAAPVRPVLCGKSEDVVSYRISYVYFPGGWSGRPVSPLADECNGPDLNDYCWYAEPGASPGTVTSNSRAAGAPGCDVYAPVGNHGAGGGNIVGADGHAAFVKRPPGGRPALAID
jgi:type II secretory pathway pseudopilin PulG